MSITPQFQVMCKIKLHVCISPVVTYQLLDQAEFGSRGCVYLNTALKPMRLAVCVKQSVKCAK